MSVQTLYTAATGMQALETKLDVIANNLANVNTTAFKKGRANFEDLFYDHQVLPGRRMTREGKRPPARPWAWAHASRASRPNSARVPTSRRATNLTWRSKGRGSFKSAIPAAKRSTRVRAISR